MPRNGLGVGLSAVHVNHGLRAEESDADQRFVSELCQRLEIPLHLQGVETSTRASSAGETIEEAARNLRYEVFAKLLQQGQANIILTAHTLDDQAETVLMKLLRGAWLEGLSAISPVLEVAGGRVLRPLLSTRRDELRAYLTAVGQPWREDSSNLDEAFTRNRLRQSVMPVLRQENPSLDHTLANLAELAREEEARWSAELARILPQLILPGKPVRGGGREDALAAIRCGASQELGHRHALDLCGAPHSRFCLVIQANATHGQTVSHTGSYVIHGPRSPSWTFNPSGRGRPAGA